MVNTFAWLPPWCLDHISTQLKVLLKMPDLIISFSECCHVYSTVISERRSCRLGTQNVFELGNQSIVCYNSMPDSQSVGVWGCVCILGGICDV